MESSYMEKQGVLGMVEHKGTELADVSSCSTILHGKNTILKDRKEQGI